MTAPKIVAYLKTQCGWSGGVRAVLGKYGLAFEERDIIQHPEFYEEMVKKTGQQLSPCVEVNGEMLPDVSGEEVEAYLVKTGLITKQDTPTDVPINAACPPDSVVVE